MTLHVPTHQAGYAGHHYLRDALIVVAAAALTLTIVGAVALLRPATVSAPADLTPAERLVEFRAGERALWQNSMGTEAERMIQFRADERALWTNAPGGLSWERFNDFRAGERDLWTSP